MPESLDFDYISEICILHFKLRCQCASWLAADSIIREVSSCSDIGRDLIVLLRTVSFDHNVIGSHVVFPQIVDHARIIDRVRKGLKKKTVGRAPVVDWVY